MIEPTLLGHMRFPVSIPFLRKDFFAFPVKSLLLLGFLTYASGLSFPTKNEGIHYIKDGRTLMENSIWKQYKQPGDKSKDAE